MNCFANRTIDIHLDKLDKIQISPSTTDMQSIYICEIILSLLLYIHRHPSTEIFIEKEIMTVKVNPFVNSNLLRDVRSVCFKSALFT